MIPGVTYHVLTLTVPTYILLPNCYMDSKSRLLVKRETVVPKMEEFIF